MISRGTILDKVGANPRGRMSTISTSKIKKIMVIRKNRREKGARAFFTGSNPHSNGDSFSRSFVDFFPMIAAKAMSIADRIR